MPSRSSTVARTALASGSSMASTRFIPSMIATLTPNLANTWASSTPIAPPPRITSEAGRSSTLTTLCQHVVRADHHFGGDAAVIGALAAHQVAFDADHLESMLRQGFGDFLATHSHAENDGVDAFSHSAERRWSLRVEPPPPLPPAPD